MEQGEYKKMFAVEDSHWWFNARKKFIASAFSRADILPGANRTIADIGSGTGGMYSFLSQYGKVIGIEPNVYARHFAKIRGVKPLRRRAHETGLRTNSVDMVCFFDVLYHKGIDDRKTLSEAYRILRPGGWLIITDCALPILFGPHDEIMYARERYILSELSAKVQRAGFRIQKQTYTFFFLFPFVAAKRLIDRFIGGDNKQSDVAVIATWLNKFFAFVCGVEASGLAYVSYSLGSSLLILAQKRDTK